jgi:hypothetical protein
MLGSRQKIREVKRDEQGRNGADGIIGFLAQALRESGPNGRREGGFCLATGGDFGYT